MVRSNPDAALSSTLLARKGDARPAMRPQPLDGTTADAFDDLGWNDMGSPVPPVLIEREALKVEIERADVIPSVSKAMAARIGRGTPADIAGAKTGSPNAKGAKVAFTLRLDTDRHLRLRLASAVTGRSSQSLVTQALDTFLLTVPDVDALVAQLPPATPKC